MKKGPRLVEVAADAPLTRTLTYLLPDRLAAAPGIGARVIAPLGPRQVTGYVVGFPLQPAEPEKPLKEIVAVLDPEPLFSPGLLRLFRWAAGYYLTSLAEVIKTALPAGINVRSQRIVRLTPAGEAAAKDPGASGSGALTGPEQAFLARVLEQGSVPGPKLRRLAGANADSVLVKRLQARGLVQVGQELQPPRVKARAEVMVHPGPPPGAEEMERLRKKAPARARLLEELIQQGPLPLAEIRERFPSPWPLIRALAAAGWVELGERTTPRDPFSLPLSLTPRPERLMPAQEQAVQAIAAGLEREQFQSFLLQGVTGSGKTEVYLRAIEIALARGKTALMLVPEIALTPQLLARFRQRFAADEIAALHSGLTPGERHDQWQRIREGQARIAVGARSAVFAPLSGLGLIVVDEEQDNAYKQDRGFMYNARDLALVRGKEEGAVVVLGSATPSLESAYRSRQEVGHVLLLLPSRVDHRPLPAVQVVDLAALREARQQEEAGPESKVKDRDRLAARELISGPLESALRQTLERKEQAILFLNRRGLFSFLVCFDCGNRFTCPNCAVSLVHHRAASRARAGDASPGRPGQEGYLLCHYCGASAEAPRVCPRCRGVRVHPFGVGTEQMAETVAELLPGARVLRMDSDVMTGRESYFQCLDRIIRGEVDVVVGTQMVAKGHDLPGVTLVGVLLADLGLNLPDFRASERTFQIITQAAGRAGRGIQPGRVVIQTFNPEHYAIKHAVAQDFEGFYREELAARQGLGYPPFSRLALFRISGPEEKTVREAASRLGRLAKQKALTRDFKARVKLLGPVRAPLFRLRGQTRWMMMVKAGSPGVMSRFLETLMRGVAGKDFPRSVKIEVDRDPGSLM